MEITKNNRQLGMVIEGGRDTEQEEPRIINILPVRKENNLKLDQYDPTWVGTRESS